MKKLLLIAALALTASAAFADQTLNVWTGDVRWAFPTADVGEMPYTDGTSLTVMGKVFAIADVDSITVNDNSMDDDCILVEYAGTRAVVSVAGNIATHITASVSGAHVIVNQDETVDTEYLYTLQGTSADGSFYTEGAYKITLSLNGLTLHNPSDAAINVRNGKRIAVELVAGTVSTLTDGAGPQKGCFAVKGHTEFKGGGTLNITGNSANAFWGKEYVEVKKTVGAINILGAVKDGINVNQYYQQNGGTVTITGTGDDGLQVSYETDDDDVIIDEPENTGSVTLKGGTLRIVMSSNGGKAIKAEGNVDTSGGTLDIVQTGGIVVSGNDISYPTSVKADGNINITGGNITIVNTADGGKGLSADGTITIDESAATTKIDIKANGKGGTAETSGTTGGDTTPASYKLYVSLPQNGGGTGGRPGSGGSAWKTVYLYKSDGTLVKQLTATVTRSNGAATATFYYYDFGSPAEGTYYFKSDNYTSGGGWSGGTTYTIVTGEVSGPTDGDIYYSITNSYTTSGTTRTYSVSNVTASYSGTSDTSEDTGTGYNAAGIKADGDITIGGGTITVANSGAMSKSVKSKKATVTINGGDITLTPSGALMVISGDAGYSTAVKAVDYVQTGGNVTINASGTAAKGVSADNDVTVSGGVLDVTDTGTGQYVGSARYTPKGLKADRNMTLAGGEITVATTQNGANGIKVNGNYVQGTSDGNGPTLTVSTQGSRFTNGTSSGGWGGGMGGKTSGQGGAAKGIKAEGTVTILGGTTQVSTKADGGEGIESKTSVTIAGGQHYLACYDDCIGSNGNIYFNGGVTVAWSNGNDAVDSNSGRTGAITIGDGVVMAYSTKGGAEEGLDCDNNSYIQITGTGIAISAGGSQGGGGGWGGSGSTISGAKQGYYFCTSSLTFSSGRYYVLGDSSGRNLVTFSFPATVSSNLALFTATGMVKGSSYNVRYLTSAPTDATTAFHGLYLGSSTTAPSTNSVTSFTAQ